jgi:cell division protein FtsN
MKKADLKEKSSAFVIGKGLVIAVILFTSSISFIIGYLVGKNTLKEGPAIRSLQENSKDMKTLPLDVTSQQKDQPQDIAPSEEGRTQKTTGEINIEAKNTQQLQKSPKIMYTVQVGAFKDAPEAESLKVRLDKKGFKAYVIPSESKREGRLYKVQLGEFATKKEAEILSLKDCGTAGICYL